MLLNILKKEFLLLRRDIHALLVLFIMPIAFILIMSLSLQDKFQENETNKLTIGIYFENNQSKLHSLAKSLLAIDGYNLVQVDQLSSNKTLAEKYDLSAIIHIPSTFFSKLDQDLKFTNQDKIQLLYAPTTPISLRKLIHASISRILASHQVEEVIASYIDNPKQQQKEKDKFLGNSLLLQKDLYEGEAKPTSVQQTVPAWLIFAMFFVVIPLSTTFLIEKQQGTLQRLRTLPTPPSYFLVGKLLPYLLINIVQMVLMFLIGIYLLPLLGGQGIQLTQNAYLLLPMSLAVSFAAISFALLIACIVKTTEQATTIGGVSNLILAAIGGIMVPTFVMPKLMQNLAGFSPMNWGLEGYLSIILRQGSFIDILPEIAKLTLFGIVLFLIALLIHTKSKNY